MIRKSAESLEASLVLQSVASWALDSLALSVFKLKHLRAANSGADAVLHGETLLAVLVADTRDELVAARTGNSDALSVDELVVLVAFGSDTAGSLLD